MIKPSALKPNATIGIVSPSSWLKEPDLKTAVSVFENKGYKLFLGESVFLKEFTYAGTPQERADDINAMFANPEIDAIICARGGYGANRVLSFLDYNLIISNPKIFMGYSDITAFLTSITEKVGPEGRFLHKGMTSSDVLDTCFNIQLLQAGKIISKDIDELLKVLKNKSLKYKKTICIGRSHGIHAEPTTFGLKLASEGVVDAEYITPLVFVIVLGTVLLNATTARLFARLVGVFLNNSEGILIVGASKVSRLIGHYLEENGRHVVLIDSNESNIAKAKELNLEAITTNIYSDNLIDNILIKHRKFILLNSLYL